MFIFLNNNLFGLNMANTCGSFLKNLSMTVIDLATFLKFYLYAIKTIVVLKKDSISFWLLPFGSLSVASAALRNSSKSFSLY